MTRASSIFAILSLAIGCTGSLSIEQAGQDSGIHLFEDDAGAALARDGAIADAGASDAVAPTTPDAGPIDPCASVRCGAHAHCTAGACRCDEGFVDSSGTCVAPLPGDPAGRTEAEVCDAWRAGHAENAWPAWTEGTSECDPGTMPADAIDDTLRRIDMFRWLAGLGPVGHDASRHREMMECANMMNVNGMLSHTPPSSWTCYTSGGAAAAGRSNIALGYPTPGAAIDGYMSDEHTESLGHRRWILSPSLGQVEIGFAGRGQCLGVFDGSGSSDRPWTSYPNQGFAPFETATITWSFQANSIELNADASVEVQRLSDGATLPVEQYQTGGYGPPPSIAFTPSGWAPAAGEAYRVTIHGTSGGDVSYEVHLVSC